MKTISVQTKTEGVLQRPEWFIEVSNQEETENVVHHFKETLCVSEDGQQFDYDMDQEQEIHFGKDAIYFLHMTESHRLESEDPPVVKNKKMIKN